MRRIRDRRIGRGFSLLSLGLLALFIAIGLSVDADYSAEREWDGPILYGLLAASIAAGFAGAIISTIAAVRHEEGRGRALAWAALGALMPVAFLLFVLVRILDPGVDFSAARL